MGISQLRIEPLPERKSFLRGYAGITKQITLAGVIRFTASKDLCTLMSLVISFQGFVHCKLSVSNDQYNESASLYSEKTRLLGDGQHPIKTIAGEHCIPFELIIRDPFLLPNYSSPLMHKSTDGCKIDYQLQVEMETLSGWFGGKRRSTIVKEDIDLPCIRLDHIISSLEPCLLDYDGFVNDIQVHVDVDRNSIHLGSMLNVCVDVSPRDQVMDLDVKLIQSEMIYAKGQSRQFDFILCQGTHHSLCKIQDRSFRSQIVLASDHIKCHGKPYKSVSVVSPFSHRLVQISHCLRVTVAYKNSFGEKVSGYLDVPMIVLDLESDMIEWIRRQFLHEQ